MASSPAHICGCLVCLTEAIFLACLLPQLIVQGEKFTYRQSASDFHSTYKLPYLPRVPFLLPFLAVLYEQHIAKKSYGWVRDSKIKQHEI